MRRTRHEQRQPYICSCRIEGLQARYKTESAQRSPSRDVAAAGCRRIDLECLGRSRRSFTQRRRTIALLGRRTTRASGHRYGRGSWEDAPETTLSAGKIRCGDLTASAVSDTVDSDCGSVRGGVNAQRGMVDRRTRLGRSLSAD